MNEQEQNIDEIKALLASAAVALEKVSTLAQSCDNGFVFDEMRPALNRVGREYSKACERVAFHSQCTTVDWPSIKEGLGL